jgi:hypothetical protein
MRPLSVHCREYGKIMAISPYWQGDRAIAEIDGGGHLIHAGCVDHSDQYAFFSLFLEQSCSSESMIWHRLVSDPASRNDIGSKLTDIVER